MTNWGNIVTGKDLVKVMKERRNPFYEKKGFTSAQADYESEKWIAVAQYKNPKYTKYQKPKPFDERFEDDVWYMFYKMGFTFMNTDRQFRMAIDPHNPALTQQIDVFAVEEDTVFVVECKSCESPKVVTYKTELEALHGKMGAIRAEIATQFKGKKVIFVWATKNAIVGAKDKERMREWGIRHFDDSVIGYYTQLANHLGTAARFQLLGNVLQGIEIKNMDNEVPAIEGKMGGLTYYSFSIEPAKLLKIGYVLHRSKANSDMMPTYQRVIKKERLLEIRKFVNNGGYFPNSVIISIDTQGRKMDFRPAYPRKDGSNSRVGTLYLPKYYHTAYIIDGQHRLYGYSDSVYADKDCIPVVAFVNLDRQDQLKIFMDINENQKAVPKKLRVTLTKDMYWDSDNQAYRRTALRSKIASALGDDSSSPLLNRVDMDEDTPAGHRSISVEEIQTALQQSNFFNTYDKKNIIKSKGTFDFDDLDKTYDVFFPYLCGCLSHFMNECSHEWNLGKDGVLTMSRGMYALIRVIDDITTLLVEQKKINPMSDTTESMVTEAAFYFDPLVKYINNLTLDQRADIREKLGTGARPKFYRYFQKPIADIFADFNPEGLEEYFENQSKKYNEASRNYLIDIEKKLRVLVRDSLMQQYGSSWRKDGVKKDILIRIHNEAFEKNLEAEPGHEVEEWDLITFTDVLQIATYSSNWSKVFEHVLVRPEEANQGGRKEAKLAWIDTLGKEFAKLGSSSHSVDKATYELIASVHKWLCGN